MKIAQIKRRIERAETLYEGRQGQARDHLQQMKQAWHDGWTPARIVVAGLGLGFVAGRSNPAGAIGGLAGKLASAPKLLQLLSTASALFGAIQSQEVTEPAASAVPDPSTAMRTQDPVSAHPLAQAQVIAPVPAEAATEVSER